MKGIYRKWLLTGMAMGAANVIPGVSGGTIAFITGIYDRLIQALKNFDLTAFKLLIKGKFSDLSTHIDFKFLLFLFLGIGISIISLAKGLELALLHYESLTMAFFFGLISASIFAVGKQITSWNLTVFIAFLAGTAIAALISFLPPASANDGFIYLLVCGIAAISSMILPGLSGSYILLLMGNYLLVLQAISSIDLSVLFPMALGCVVGLILFSRLLGYLLNNYKNITTAVLTGFVAGSLIIIWPWKNPIYLEISSEKSKVVGYDWYLPQLDFYFIVAILLALVGYVLVWAVERNNP